MAKKYKAAIRLGTITSRKKGFRQNLNGHDRGCGDSSGGVPIWLTADSESVIGGESFIEIIVEG